MFTSKKKSIISRSQLAVPASRSDFFEKASKSKCDIVFLDLEDSVSLNKKQVARKLAVEAINDINWGDKIISVRVNAFNTVFFKEDIEYIVKNASSRLDLIMLPKSEKEEDIVEACKLVSSLENKQNKSKKVGFELIIESALGLINIEKLAISSTRNEALHFGSADLAASIGAKTTNIGGIIENYGVLENKAKRNNFNTRKFYPNDMWHYSLFKIVLTARAFGLRAIDCPYGDYTDKEGFFSIANNSYAMGFEGKMVIHPNQIEWANEVYSPTEKEINTAKEILDTIEDANKKGKGAIAFKGKLLDIVSIKQAKNILEFAKKVNKKEE